MRILVRIVALYLGLAAPCAWAQSSEAPPSSPAQPQSSTKADSAPDPKALQALRQQIEDILTTLKKKPGDQFYAQVNELQLPDAKEWFSPVFGAEYGEAMAQKYTGLWPRFESSLENSFKNDHDRKRTDISVRQASERDLMDLSKVTSAMQTPVAMYIVSTSRHGVENSLSPGFYVFVQGRFRCLPLSVFRVLPGVRKSRVRISGDVTLAKLVNAVKPICPADAHVKGAVVFRAIIAEDGSVSELTYVSGSPLLEPSAMEAVKQWRYETTYLNGEPIEVDTSISVTCSQGR
jgi:hypothetical protein